MDIEGLGEKNVELLISSGLIKNFEDIYKLKVEDLMRLPRFAARSAHKLVDAIERSTHTPLAKFLFAIGILHVGEYTARLLARNFKRLEDLYRISAEKISSIKQIGEKTATSVATFFSDEKNIATLERLKALGLKIENPDYAGPDIENLPFAGMTFVITGTMPVARHLIEERIERLGGHVASSVSRSTSFVVAGDKPGSKIEKARELGVKIISYEDLLKMIESLRDQPQLF
jgi:DNA ligase (NAD+)